MTQKRKKEEVPSTDWKSPEYLKNEMRFKLLSLLPSFQGDVQAIREELKIPQNGLKNDEDFRLWHEQEMVHQSDKVISSKKFSEALKKIHHLEREDHAEYLKQNWLLHDTIPINRIKNRMETLGRRYNLPANFYEQRPCGLYFYITKNALTPPSSNWVIQFDHEARKGTTKWLAIQTYAPLSKKEFEDAKKMLVPIQKHYFPKSITIGERAKKQFDRDFEIYKELVLERKKKPVKRKTHTGYLAYIKNPDDRRKLEKLHPNDVGIEFDETTSREVAEKLKITPDAVRQAMTRMGVRIEEFFSEGHLER